MECTWRKGTFMHGKGFIKFEVAFQFFLRMFFKEIKALQTHQLV
jgi:hypothetical protein